VTLAERTNVTSSCAFCASILIDFYAINDLEVVQGQLSFLTLESAIKPQTRTEKVLTRQLIGPSHAVSDDHEVSIASDLQPIF
jgi:hypothetical protein